MIRFLSRSCCFCTLAAALASAPLFQTLFAEARTWTDVDGRSIVATALGKTEGEVRIRREDGMIFTIPLARLSEEDRRWLASWEPPTAPRMTIEDGVVLIETPSSRGSGFLAQFPDGIHLVTNQHVIEGTPINEIKITNLHGQRLTARAVQVSPTQDLARLAVDAPAGFPIRFAASHDAEIVAYGNSRGGGVATVNRGKIVGVAQDVLEVTAEIVQGNSGGPILDQDRHAIGVASFVTRESLNPKDWVTRGTRYDQPRRFAIRLQDNLAWQNVDWPRYAAEAKRIKDAETMFDQALELAGAIIADPTQRLASRENYPAALQDIIRTHNDHVRRFEANVGREVSNAAALRRANQAQNANFRSRLRQIPAALSTEVASLRTGKPPPSTPYLNDRVKKLEQAVAEVTTSLDEIMRVERTFYVLR
jgi:hypothetical protein